jgi:hypothetical protein
MNYENTLISSLCLQIASQSVADITLRQSVSLLTGLYINHRPFSKSTNQYDNMEIG